MEPKGIVLYIGGFELPDKNAAAQRVIGIAKSIRELGYQVVFLNSLKQKNAMPERKTAYYGFTTYEYDRETDYDYLVSAKTCLSKIKSIMPSVVIAYNYPAFALERIRRHCVANGIKCIADVTEWYKPIGRSIYRVVKSIDTSYRMRVVHKKVDGVIAISRYLYEYYKPYTTTVLIPPTVDIRDGKWEDCKKTKSEKTNFVYAGSPSAQKERLDIIVQMIEQYPANCIHLNVLGISEKQFRGMYQWDRNISDRVTFLGRVEHKRAIEIIGQSDWSMILRDDNSVVRAGFPTKLVESISAGTPVIINRFSNVEDYLNDDNSILLDQPECFASDVINQACRLHLAVDNTTFDYNAFMEQIKFLLL